MLINRVIFHRHISAEFLLTGSGGFSGSSIMPATSLGSFSGGVRGLGSEALLNGLVNETSYIFYIFYKY